MRKKLRYVLLVTVLGACIWALAGSGPGLDAAPEPQDSVPRPPVLAISAEKGEVAGTPRPAHPPGTEEALVEAVARAIEGRDLVALQATVAPELAAELSRLHGAGVDGFWQRGLRWVDNVRSGFVVTAREEPDAAAESWRALLSFGNGQKEAVVFTRVGGKLVFEEI
jgi:hypothetical protein